MATKRQRKATLRVQSIVDPTLERPLLNLHAAIDVDSFWKAVQNVIQSGPPELFDRPHVTAQSFFAANHQIDGETCWLAFSRSWRSRNISALIRTGTSYSLTIFFPMSVILEGLHFTVVVSCR